MDPAYGGAGSSKNQDGTNSEERHHRLSYEQIQCLEAMFQNCSHPKERQLVVVSMKLGLEPLQVKFWFQNRRTRERNKKEHVDNKVLKVQNKCIRDENAVLESALKNVVCPNCVPGRCENIQKLRLENAQLKQVHEKLIAFVSYNLGISSSELLANQYIQSSDLATGSSGSQGDPSHPGNYSRNNLI